MALAWAAAAWIAGVVAAAALGAAAWPLALALAAILLALALLRRDPRIVAYAAILPLIFAAGLARFVTFDDRMAEDDVARLAGGPSMRIRGIVRDDPDIGDTTQRFAISVRELQRAGGWQRASGGVLVGTGLLPRLAAGDVVELEGQLELPSSVGAFDYAEYLAQRGVRSVLAFPGVRIVGHEDDNALAATILDVRRRLSRGLTLALPEPHASLAQGVVLGRRAALPRDLNDDLNATNTSHLVVVSGANVVLVAAFATGLLTWLVGRRRALLLSACVVLAYMLLVGLSPPVLRGTIMGLLLVLAQVTGRRTNAIVSIAFAAALMLGLDPRSIRDVSFQLSFAATVGIVSLSPPLHDWILEGLARLLRRETLPRPVSTFIVLPLSTTIAAIVATEPLIALNFGTLSLVAVPANMLVIPLFPYMLTASAFAAVGGLVPHLHLVLGAPAYYLLGYWMAVADRLASYSFSAISFSGYSSSWALLTYAVLAAFGWAVQRQIGRPRTQRLAAAADWGRLVPFASVAVPVTALVASAAFALQASSPRRLEVTVLDVGQGDAILIETPSGDDILIDGGPGPAVLRGLAGEMPWHDRSIELLVLTHPQADHLYGLLDVLDRYDVRRVIAGPGQAETAGFDAWLAAVSGEGLMVERADSSASFDLGDGVRLYALAPVHGPAASKINNTSLVLRLVVGDVSFLFTGDIEADAETALIADGAELRSTVLKVPHHGSNTSSSRALLDVVQPSIAVVSAGKDNRFGHPHADVLARLREWSEVFLTARSGAVHFETDGERIWISVAGE